MPCACLAKVAGPQHGVQSGAPQVPASFPPTGQLSAVSGITNVLRSRHFQDNHPRSSCLRACMVGAALEDQPTTLKAVPKPAGKPPLVTRRIQSPIRGNSYLVSWHAGLEQQCEWERRGAPSHSVWPAGHLPPGCTASTAAHAAAEQLDRSERGAVVGQHPTEPDQAGGHNHFQPHRTRAVCCQ